LALAINGGPLPAAVVNVDPNVGIGTIHANFDPRHMTVDDIYSLIVWYNQDFGIVENDALGARCDKVMRWLTDYSYFLITTERG
jgi:hypothetical protein